MEKRVNYFFKFLFIFVLFFTFVKDSDALESSYKLTKKDKIYYSSNGNYASSGRGYIIEHYFGKLSAYCMQWTLSTTENSTYKKWTNFNYGGKDVANKNRMIAGKIIELGEEKYKSNEKEKHLYITEAINCLFNLSGSKCYKEGKGYQLLKDAKDWVNKNTETCSGTNKAGCLNYDDFKISTSSKTLNSLNGSTVNFISKKVTLAGLISKYGGTDVKYTLTVSSNKGDVSICTKQDGKDSNCVGKSLTIPVSGASYSFYVRIKGGTNDSEINIKAVGSNSASYPYATAYRYTSSKQALMVADSNSLSRKVQVSTTLNVPDVDKIKITGSKVDEYGNDLKGATLKIYGATDANGSGKKELATNTNGATSVKYSEDKVANATSLKYNYYCFGETTAPKGYIYGASQSALKCVSGADMLKKNSTTCYDSNDKETNMEYCESKSACPNGTTSNENGKCVKSSSDEVTTEEKEPTATDSVSICPTKDGKEGTLSDDKTTCTYEDSTTGAPEMKVNLTCPDGFSQEGTKCVKRSCKTTGYTYVAGELPNSGTCTAVVSAVCKYNDKEVDAKYCEADSSNYYKVTLDSGNVSFEIANTMTKVGISKKDITGENELAGARMKICTDKPNDSLECSVATVTKVGECSDEEKSNKTCTENSDETVTTQVSWISSGVTKYVRGLETNKNYYLVETVAPNGYSVASYTQFKISSDGKVTSGEKTVSDGNLIIKDDLTKITISKTDIATSKELPGAIIKICNSGKDENDKLVMSVDQAGDCSIATLADGTDAIWNSTDKPKEISGLAAGTYYLVEDTAPNGYSTAESIVFTLNANGKLTDVDGNSLDNNKLIMKDAPIKNVKTGQLSIAMILVICVVAILTGSYFYNNKRAFGFNNGKNISDKIRKRKIHK